MSSTSAVISPMQVVNTMANGIMTMAVVSAMLNTFGNMVPYVAVSSAGAKYHNAPDSGIKKQSQSRAKKTGNAELDMLYDKVRKINYAMAEYDLVGTRQHQEYLMKKYGLTVMPSVTELRKYPDLRATERDLRIAEVEVARLEINRLVKMKRIKELEAALGIGTKQELEEMNIPPHHSYTAYKKFSPPMRKYDT